VIMFLGDGMSLPTITAARIYKGQLGERGPDEPRGEQDHLSFENFPFTGMAKVKRVGLL
jgi:Alkaline phosphatase